MVLEIEASLVFVSIAVLAYFIWALSHQLVDLIYRKKLLGRRRPIVAQIRWRGAPLKLVPNLPEVLGG